MLMLLLGLRVVTAGANLGQDGVHVKFLVFEFFFYVFDRFITHLLELALELVVEKVIEDSNIKCFIIFVLEILF